MVERKPGANQSTDRKSNAYDLSGFDKRIPVKNAFIAFLDADINYYNVSECTPEKALSIISDAISRGADINPKRTDFYLNLFRGFLKTDHFRKMQRFTQKPRNLPE
jgi:hypothetical protein